MLAAVEMWVKRDHDAEFNEWERWLDLIAADTLGNGLQTLRGFDAVTGLPHYIQSGAGGGTETTSAAWARICISALTRSVTSSITPIPPTTSLLPSRSGA